MASDEPDEPDDDHETVLQAVLRSVLTSDDLDRLCEDAGTAVLLDAHGHPLEVRSAHTYADAGVLTLDRGVLLELSDGSRFGLTISVASRGHGDTTVRPPA